MARNFRVRREDALLLVIDVQARLAPVMNPERMGHMVQNLERLGPASRILDVPAVVTVQYTKGLGHTIEPVAKAFEGVEPMEKMHFSCGADETIRAAIEATGKKTVLVTGMETHVCVWQTVRDLVPDYDVHLISDALASRTEANYQVGVDLARQAGATITSTEVVLFDMLHKAGGDTFKAISKLVK